MDILCTTLLLLMLLLLLMMMAVPHALFLIDTFQSSLLPGSPRLSPSSHQPCCHPPTALQLLGRADSPREYICPLYTSDAADE